MKKVTLELKNGLKFYVSGQEITLALQNVNLKLTTGEFVAVTGESGSGKSTLAHVLAGIFPCEQGELLVDGMPTEQNTEAEWEDYRREYISFVAQNYGILPGNTVMENVISALLLSGMTKREAKQRASYLLKQVDLWKLRRRKAGKLSSGQKQRLSVARAVAKPAPVLVADEPTSNLDWSTASKIIKLLHEASKERLVVMVTHNFEQVKDVATRHLVMRDGELKEDSVIKESNELCVSEEAKKQEAARNLRNSRYIAGLQLKARPIWSILMFLCFALTAFAVFAFLGSFFVALDDTGTRYYSTEAFLNGVDDRLVVMTEDKRFLTEEDYKKLLEIPWVRGIEKYGILSDINYYYREGTDYTYEITSEGGGMTSNVVYKRQVVLLDSDCYLQTVPVMRENEEFLKAGRYPVHMNEVVAVGSVKQIGSTVDVFFHDKNTWASDIWHKETMTIVGVTDIGSGLYFDDRIGVTFWQEANRAEELGRDFGGYGLYYFVNEGTYRNTVENGKPVQKEYYLATGDLISTLWRRNHYERVTFPKGLRNLNTNEVVELPGDYLYNRETNLPFYIGMSEELFDELSTDTYCFQATVWLTDYSYAERTMEAIEELGYAVISPYKISSRVQVDELAKERMTTLVLCMMALFVALVAQVVVLCAMFATELGNYTQLRNLGLSCYIGQLSAWLQIGLFTVLGQLAGGALIYFGAGSGVEMLTEVAKFLTPFHVVLFSLVHICGSAVLGICVSIMIKNKVFPFLPPGNEVDLSELEEPEGGRA